MNAGAGGCVCGQVKLPSVMDPLQGLRKQPITSEYVYTAGILVTEFDTVSINCPNLKTWNKLGHLKLRTLIKLKLKGSLYY